MVLTINRGGIPNPLMLERSAYTKTPMTRGFVEHFGTKPAIYIDATVVYDDATPILRDTGNASHHILRTAMLNAGHTIKRRVQKDFIMATQNPDNINSLWTQQIKGSHIPLIERGNLKKMVDEAKVEIEDDGGTILTRVTWDIPETSRGLEYLWIQERGARMSKIRTPSGAIEDYQWDLRPRPFFLNAINNAERDASLAVAATYYPVLEYLSTTKGIKTEKFGVKLFPTMLSTTFTGFMAYFLPPAKFYAYIGAGTDISGAFTGNLLSEKQMFGWGRQYMWGQVGATRKTVRRKFRRKLWD